MFCPNCGAKNDDTSLFCESCGTSLAEAAKEIAESRNQMENAVNAAPVQPEAQPQAAEAVQQEVQQEVQQAPVQPEPQQALVQPEATVNDVYVQPEAAVNMNGMPVQGQPQAAQPVQPQAVPKKKFKIPAWVFILSGAIVAVIIAAVAFVMIGISGSDYKKTVKAYVTAMQSGDYEKAYGYLGTQNSEFLTKEAFVKAHENDEKGKITNIVINDSYQTAPNAVTKRVDVNYVLESGEIGYTAVTVQKAAKKHMLFFNKYDINTEGIVVSDALITIPKGFELSVNGSKLGEGYISKDNNSSSADTYKLPKIFAGEMQIDVNYADIVNYSETVDVYGGSNNSLIANVVRSRLEISEAAQNTLKEKAKADVKTLMQAALDKKNFSEIASMCSNNKKAAVQRDYENGILYDLHSSYRDTTSLIVSNLESNIKSIAYSSDYDTGLPNVKVYVSYDLAGQYNTSYSDTSYEGYLNVKGSTYSLSYIYEDGQWKISDIYLEASLRAKN